MCRRNGSSREINKTELGQSCVFLAISFCVRMNQKACIFCDSPLSKAGKANEDVIPKWLLKHLGLDKRKDLIASSHLTDLGIALKRPRIQGSHTVLQGSVCAECNNGWMSDLEGRAKPIISGMSVGERLTLSHDDCELVSAWIFKTLILWHITANYRRLVPPPDFKYLYEHRTPPPGRHIEIAYAHSELPSAFRTRMSPIKLLFLGSEYDKQIISREVDQSSFVLTMQIGRLLTQIVGLPPFGAWARADGGHASVFRIFPRIPNSLDWPPSRTFTETIDGFNAHVAVRLLFL